MISFPFQLPPSLVRMPKRGHKRLKIYMPKFEKIYPKPMRELCKAPISVEKKSIFNRRFGVDSFEEGTLPFQKKIQIDAQIEWPF